MYVSDKYVFIHMNKAAGVSVKDWLIKYHKARICRYKHAPLRMLPEKHYGKMKIGCVRDPFDWYVSYFNYLCQEKRITTLNFKRFVEIYVRHPRALFDFMGSKVRKQFENLYPPKTDLLIGGWTFHFINYFFFDSRKILRGELPCRFENHNMEYLMKTENLEEDMIRVFGDYYQKSIINWPHKNKSKRRQKNYWTPDLRKLIIEREKGLMEYLGYTD